MSHSDIQPLYHRLVQRDLYEAMRYYKEVSQDLSEDFYRKFFDSIDKILINPQGFHFDPSGLRRCSLVRFPYHILYDLKGKDLRIWVLKHNKRNPKLGIKRFF